MANLLAVHESLFLLDIKHFCVDVVLCAELVLDPASRQTNNPPSSSRHLRHILGAPQTIDQLVQSVGGQVRAQYFQLLQQLFLHLWEKREGIDQNTNYACVCACYVRRKIMSMCFTVSYRAADIIIRSIVM